MLHVGLTGNIASGKSTAAAFFAEFGAHIIDADRVGHAMLLPGTTTWLAVREAFGDGILRPNGEIDRKALGRIVFSDRARLLELNAILHPEVGREIARRISEFGQSARRGIVVVDAALMVETGAYRMYHRLVVVTCDPSLQLSRLMRRDGLSEEEARARIASQMPAEEKVKLAHYTIDASGTLEQTRGRVERVYKELILLDPVRLNPSS